MTFRSVEGLLVVPVPSSLLRQLEAAEEAEVLTVLKFGSQQRGYEVKHRITSPAFKRAEILQLIDETHRSPGADMNGHGEKVQMATITG